MDAAELRYFYCFHILTIAHKTFNNLDLDEINRLVVKTPSSYTLRKALNIDVSSLFQAVR